MRKVALVGFASSSIQTDWPEDVEIWTINCAWRYGFDRITRLFEMHKVEQLTSYIGKQVTWENEHWDWLQKIDKFPVYMLTHDDRIPASVAYPLDEILDDVFQGLHRGEAMVKYMTSSASFLLAQAIHEKVDEINLAGFEMATGSEYTYQRDGMTFLVGVAIGRGIRVNLSEKSNLMVAKIYGYEGGQTVDRALVQTHWTAYEFQKASAVTAYEAAAKVNDFDKGREPFMMIFRADGAMQSITHLLGLSDGGFFGRQTLEAHLKNYESQHSAAMGFFNRYNAQVEKSDDAVKRTPTKANKKRLEDDRQQAEKSYRTMLLCEGGIQAMQNLIAVCDLQDPNLALKNVSRFIEEKKS